MERSAHQQRVEEFMVLAGQRVEDEPMIPDANVRELRARLIFEEALETIQALGFEITLHGEYELSLMEDYIQFKEQYVPNLIDVVDGCCDIAVVTTGTLSACGVPNEEVQQEVDLNNLAKFTPPLNFDDHGKLIKPINHKPPRLREILERCQQRSVRLRTLLRPLNESETRKQTDAKLESLTKNLSDESPPVKSALESDSESAESVDAS